MNFEDLQSMAQQAYNEKIEYERQAIDRKAKVELENLKKAIDLINSKAIFKKEKREGSYVDNFVLANEEMLCSDYIKAKDSNYGSIIRFSSPDSINNSYGISFTVGYKNYYDMAYLLNAYEAEIQKLVKSLREDYHRATQRLEDFHRYMYSLPEIKSMVAVWREAQEETE